MLGLKFCQHPVFELPGEMKMKRVMPSKRSKQPLSALADHLAVGAEENALVGRRRYAQVNLGGGGQQDALQTAEKDKTAAGFVDPLAALKLIKAKTQEGFELAAESSDDSDEEEDEEIKVLRRRRATLRTDGALLEMLRAGNAKGSAKAPRMLQKLRDDQVLARKHLASAKSMPGAFNRRQTLARPEVLQRSRSYGVVDRDDDSDTPESSDNGSSDGSDSEEDTLHSQILSKLKLKSDASKRRDRIDKLTLLHFSSKVKLPGGIDEKDRIRFQEVFTRYDCDHSGGLDFHEVYDALADLGCRPVEKQDRKLLYDEVMQKYANHLDFQQFCLLVKDLKQQIDESHRPVLEELFAKYDQDSSGALSAEELLLIIEDLDLRPTREDEQLAFLDAVVESDVDGSGEIEFDEFQVLVRSVMRKISECRREREVRIAQQVHLPPKLFLTMRPHLLAVHDMFIAMDETSSGAIMASQLAGLLLDLGFDTSLKSIHEKLLSDPETRRLIEGDAPLDFSQVVNVVGRFRDASVESLGDLQKIFDRYDIDQDGGLGEEELQRLMQDLGLKAGHDFNEVQKLFQEMDANGDGSVCLEEFQFLFKHVTELQRRQKREVEKNHAHELGFSDHEFDELREVFSMLDGGDKGCLTYPEVFQALQALGHTSADTTKIAEFDTERVGSLSFDRFIGLMGANMTCKSKDERTDTVRRLSQQVFGTVARESQLQHAPTLGVLEEEDDDEDED